MAPVYRLNQDLGADRPGDMDDVWVTKQNLHLNGYHDMPEYGLTRIPTGSYSRESKISKRAGLAGRWAHEARW